MQDGKLIDACTRQLKNRTSKSMISERKNWDYCYWHWTRWTCIWMAPHVPYLVITSHCQVHNSHAFHYRSHGLVENKNRDIANMTEMFSKMTQTS